MSHSSSPKSAGVFGRAFSRFVAAREQQARIETAPYLLSLDDATLGALGHDRKTLEALARRATSIF